MLLSLMSIVLGLKVLVKFPILIYGFVLTGGDESYEINAIKLLYRFNTLKPELIDVNRRSLEYLNFPFSHLQWYVYTKITNLKLEMLPVFVPAFINFLILLILIGPSMKVSFTHLKMHMLIVATTLLFMGYSGFFWNFFVRETYGALFGLLILYLVLFRHEISKTSSYYVLIVLFTIALVRGHFATSVFIILILSLVSMIISRNVSSNKDEFRNKIRHNATTSLLVLVIIFLTSIITDIFWLGYFARWLQIVYQSFASTELLELKQFSSSITGIGIKLALFERLLIYLHYVGIILLCSLSTKMIIHSSASNSYSKGFLLNLITLPILYFLLIFAGRVIFLEFETRYAFLRFSSWIMLLWYWMIILNLRTINFKTIQFPAKLAKGKYSIKSWYYYLSLSLVLSSILLGNLAHYPYTLKYDLPKSNPYIVSQYIEKCMPSESRYVLVFLLDNYWASLLDSYQVSRPHAIAIYNPELNRLFIVKSIENFHKLPKIYVGYIGIVRINDFSDNFNYIYVDNATVLGIK